MLRILYRIEILNDSNEVLMNKRNLVYNTWDYFSGEYVSKANAHIYNSIHMIPYKNLIKGGVICIGEREEPKVDLLDNCKTLYWEKERNAIAEIDYA